MLERVFTLYLCRLEGCSSSVLTFGERLNHFYISNLNETNTVTVNMGPNFTFKSKGIYIRNLRINITEQRVKIDTLTNHIQINKRIEAIILK